MSAALTKLRQDLLTACQTTEVLTQIAQYLIGNLLADRVVISDFRSGEKQAIALNAIDGSMLLGNLVSIENGQMCFHEHFYSQTIFVSNSAISRLYHTLEHVLRENGIRSFAAIPLFDGGKISGVIELHYCQLYQRWQRSDLNRLEHLADICGWALDRVQGDPRPVAVNTEQGGEKLDDQAGRIQALYELSHTLTVDLDPAIVALRGLRSLIRATSCSAGVCAFVNPTDENLEIVAAEGVSARYLEGLSESVNKRTLLHSAVKHHRGFRVADIQQDARAAQQIAVAEGLRAAVIVPLAYEDSVYGALVLFHRSVREFSADDYQLVSAAAQQICLIARQAEFLAAEKRNAQSLRALYQLTHELAKHFTASEVAEHAFPIIQQQVSCKRMWLATLNEHGTHLVGQAGFGPGLKERIVKLQIQRAQRHEFLDQAIESRNPVVVPKGSEMDCAGLRIIMKRLDLSTFIILPLVSLGQVVGVLLLEPDQFSAAQAERQVSLLERMAGEIATVILARRFESRMAADDKMRTAGLLASGVAHNFNNILQAIMGQASLVEMQLGKESPLGKSAQLIIDSAHRGAGLIKQLVACTVGESQTIENVDVKKMVEESRDFYRSILGSPIDLRVTVAEDVPEILVDYGRVQQTIASILVNAKETIGSRTDGSVEVHVAQREIPAIDSDLELLPGNYAEIVIRDNGKGLDGEQQARIFEPFYALYNEDARTQIGAGAGLNLSAAFALIRNYGGSISVSSQLEHGSEFVILIPEASLRDQGRKNREDRIDTRVPAEEATVLLFDLDQSLAASIASLVESMGETIAAVKKRQQLRDLCTQSDLAAEIIVVDTDRASEDFVGFVRELRKLKPGLPLLIVSFDSRRWMRLLRGIEDLQFIAKPQSIWSLDKLLRGVLKKKLGQRLEDRVERLTTEEHSAESATDKHADKEDKRSKEH